MAITISGTDGIVGAGFTVDASGVSVTAGVGTFSSLNAAASGLTGALPALDAANLTSIKSPINRTVIDASRRKCKYTTTLSHG